jgi:pyruvate dehydrogenase E2 component (dihydrolipoamide acetyltransferase)
MYGIDRFQAIINPPEAAILAVGRIRDLAWVTAEGILQQPIMNLRLSIDHRALDGVVAAPFLVDIQKSLENPDYLI